MSYDVLVVGARVAGSALAIPLARAGMRVLVVDRARFPSDTLSTHQVQVPGAAYLHRLGALERLLAAGTPPTRHLVFDQGRSSFRAPMPTVDGVDVMVSPRRTRLDATLLDIAREAGAEVREGFAVDEVCVEAGRVTGIRGAARGGGVRVTERATVVVGADGKHSIVARSVGAREYDRIEPRSMAAYTYWSGLPVDGGEIHTRQGRATAFWPTDDDLTLCFLAQPAAVFAGFHRDMEGGFLAAMEAAGLGERLGAGQRAERIRATTDLPAVKRRPYGPGWALVGDAGLTMDPITGQGISFALRDADLLARALVAGLGGGGRLDRRLHAYHRDRDRAAGPMYDFTASLSRVAPPTPAEDDLFAAIAERPEAAAAFVAAFTGARPLPAFMSPAHLVRLVGPRGVWRLMRDREAA